MAATEAISDDFLPPVTDTIEPQTVPAPVAIEVSALQADDVIETAASETPQIEDPVVEQPALDEPVAGPARSIGDAILAGGLLSRPVPKHDLLAPLRRMSQAEKVAFFT